MAEDLWMGKKQENTFLQSQNTMLRPTSSAFNMKQYVCHDEIEVRLALHTSHWWLQETLPSHKFRFYLGKIISCLTRNGFYHYSLDQ